MFKTKREQDDPYDTLESRVKSQQMQRRNSLSAYIERIKEKKMKQRELQSQIEIKILQEPEIIQYK